MYMKLVIYFLMSFGAANLQEDHLISSLESKHYDFYKLNSVVHTTMNKLLTLVKLDKDFAEYKNIQSLVSLLHQFNDMAEDNCGAYKELGKISKAAIAIGLGDNINLEEILHVVVKDEIDNIKNNIGNGTQNKFEPKASGNRTEYSSTEYSLEAFHEILLQLNYSTLENIIDPILKEIEVNEKLPYYIDHKTQELKAWSPSSVESESTNIDTRRIYKGKKTKIKDFPFLVSVHVMRDFICAGSIISKDMVITAASCLQMAHKNKLYLENPSTIFVRVGSDYTENSGELIPIVEIIFHPQYDSVTLRNNLAIVRMLEKLKHTKKRKIKRIKYDRERRGLRKDGNKITILGWGDRDEKHKTNSLQKVAAADLDIYDLKDCEEIYSKYYVTETNFCAGFVTKGGGACMGDVGGPAVTSDLLVGLVSFGPSVCGMRDAPTVFTKVGFYTEWIDSVIRQEPANGRWHSPESQTTKTTANPELVLFPVYTTATQKNLRQKDKEEHKTTDYPEEIVILKEIIQEFVLNNNTVIDYLLEGDILEDNDDFDVTTKPPKKFHESLNVIPTKASPKKKKVTRFPKDIKTTRKSISEENSIENTKNLENIETIDTMQTHRHPFFKSTRVHTDYEDVANIKKKTTLRTMSNNYESSSEYEEIAKRPDGISRSYEEMPIGETNLRTDLLTNLSKNYFHKYMKPTTKIWYQNNRFLSTVDEIKEKKTSFYIYPTETKYNNRFFDLTEFSRFHPTNMVSKLWNGDEKRINTETERNKEDKRIYAQKLINYSQRDTTTYEVEASAWSNIAWNVQEKERKIERKTMEEIRNAPKVINYSEKDTTKDEVKTNETPLSLFGTTMPISDEDFDYLKDDKMLIVNK